jgi:DNA modification methylase
MKAPEIIYLDPRRLKPSPHNTRRHSAKQKGQLLSSVSTFGFNGVLAVNQKMEVLAGHLRWEVAKELGLKAVPCIVVDHLTEAQERAYQIADNQIALNATYDNQKLGTELIEILQLDPIIDLTVTGFDALEIQDMIEVVQPGSEASTAEEDVLPEVDEKAPPVTQLGDIWLCGNHKLINGDAQRKETFEKLMGDDRAQMGLTDPPYNLPAKTIGGSGRSRHGNFKMASGEMSEARFTAFLETTLLHMAEFSISGSIQMSFMDHRHVVEIITAGKRAYTELKNIVVWDKGVGSRGFYRNRHELIFVFKSGKARHIDNIGVGKGKRYRTNVWTYRGANTGGATRLKDLEDHPTVKPARMLADAILDCSQPGGIVLDPFAGSGSTGVACEMTGRRARLIEIDPHYCDVAVRRWQEFAKADAIHAATGETFNARAERLARERAVPVEVR